MKRGVERSAEGEEDGGVEGGGAVEHAYSADREFYRAFGASVAAKYHRRLWPAGLPRHWSPKINMRTTRKYRTN